MAQDTPRLIPVQDRAPRRKRLAQVTMDLAGPSDRVAEDPGFVQSTGPLTVTGERLADVMARERMREDSEPWPERCPDCGTPGYPHVPGSVDCQRTAAAPLHDHEATRQKLRDSGVPEDVITQLYPRED